jgi:glutathione S-transferase
MASARKLVALDVSPWSERARWALDHHGLKYDVVTHLPILGERRLRRLVGWEKPRATVPVLVAGTEVVSESWDIALYADREGAGTKLVPQEHEAAIRAWCALADETGNAGRALVVAATLASGPALDERVPFVPAWLRPALRPVGRAVTRAFARKYALPLEDSDTHTRQLRAALERLRSGLTSSSPHLQGFFSYADIVMATLIQGIMPVDDRFLKIGPATRATWTNPVLAAEFADLVTWRDRLYASHRHTRPVRGERDLPSTVTDRKVGL